MAELLARKKSCHEAQQPYDSQRVPSVSSDFISKKPPEIRAQFNGGTIISDGGGFINPANRHPTTDSDMDPDISQSTYCETAMSVDAALRFSEHAVAESEHPRGVCRRARDGSWICQRRALICRQCLTVWCC
jgi:hypothetical protein